MKRCSRCVAWTLAGLLVAGGLAAVVGLVPVAASSGHWPASAWLLHFVMRRSVQMRSLPVQAPELDDPVLVVRGAGHYESGCAPCHGAPGMTPSAVTREMTPHPPRLSERISEWSPEELFWIVKHGVKFTGMPAWPAQQRDDEVWSVVAFLLQLPALDARGYLELARGAADSHAGAVDAASPLSGLATQHRETLATCARCHLDDGSARGQGAFPRLAGQSEAYLLASLEAYADGARYSGIMQPLVSGLDQRTLRELARHYATQRNAGTPSEDNFERDLIEHGERIARRGLAERGVPSCTHCHGPAEQPRNPHYPVLAGQYREYLIQQMKLFTEDKRGGSSYLPVMNEAAHRLDKQQIEAVAAWYASLPPDENRQYHVLPGTHDGAGDRR